jgi:PTH1 family peptidyl-tRNA hydrolase
VKLLVGLGNHGSKYDGTRHNLGWMALVEWMKHNGGIESFRHQEKFKGQVYSKPGVTCLFPETYMNKSGESVLAAMQGLGVELKDVLVLHDELDLPALSCRLKLGGGPGGHNGVRSVIALCGDAFWRMRLGIGKPEDARFEIADWVLSKFSKDELAAWEKLLPGIHETIDMCLADQHALAMNKFNRKA